MSVPIVKTLPSAQVAGIIQKCWDQNAPDVMCFGLSVSHQVQEAMVALAAPDPGLAKYLKEGETPLQRIERDQGDMLGLLDLLAAEKRKVQTLTTRLLTLTGQPHEVADPDLVKCFRATGLEPAEAVAAARAVADPVTPVGPAKVYKPVHGGYPDPQAPPVESTETAWLVQLMDVAGQYLNVWHTGLTDLQGASRTTRDVLKAKRYRYKENAEAEARKLFSQAYVWAAASYDFTGTTVAKRRVGV